MTYVDSAGVYVSDFSPLDKVALDFLYGGDGIGGSSMDIIRLAR